MGKIIKFPLKHPSKFGFERVGKPRKEDASRHSARLAEVRRIPSGLSPFEEALLLDEHGDNRAAAAYLRSISEGAFVADAYCNLGIIESRAGRMAKAFDCFTKSLENDPRHFESHYNLGNLYFETDNLRLARMHYELAAEVNPGFPNLYFNLGLVLALLQEIQASIEAFLKYQQLAPSEERKNADEVISGLRRSLASTGGNTSR